MANQFLRKTRPTHENAHRTHALGPRPMDYDSESDTDSDGFGWLGGRAELDWWSTFAEWL